MKNLKPFLIIIILGLFIFWLISYLNLKKIENQIFASLNQIENLRQKEEKALNNFAQCLNEKGVKFYGAFWDTHTQNQRRMFGEAIKYLSYIECMEGETREMTWECLMAEIDYFPLWEFPDGKRKVGQITLKELAELSGCPLHSLRNFKGTE